MFLVERLFAAFTVVDVDRSLQVLHNQVAEGLAAEVVESARRKTVGSGG